jgi:hypothetical protein
VPIDPGTFAARLTEAGFADVDVVKNEYGVRFRAWKASRPDE